ncbi:DUF630 family protein (DUF630 and DUF632) [Quillaja saponaria]|uniref:DUF630 family protein (DUF630 and DUF632) n=1 Tax=Quillaja saponaria TaxID=32244 RepID=A0AAD7LCX2_QUISA|nr:DUF630 family protein (DUF630 and DUF632) [Quillaja saponaria]
MPPPSPQTSQWDFFWNPFSSLDYYGYPNQSSLDHTVMDDEVRGLRQVREEEGIPELEEDETEQEDTVEKVNVTDDRTKIYMNVPREEVTVEDVDEDEDGMRKRKKQIVEVKLSMKMDAQNPMEVQVLKYQKLKL